MTQEKPNTDLRDNSEDDLLVLTHTATGATVYAIIRNTEGEVWRTDTAVWEAYATANLANYTIAMTELGTASQAYRLQLPQDWDLIDPDWATATTRNVRLLYIDAYSQSGGSPAEGDAHVGTEDFWIEKTAGNHGGRCRPRSIVNETVDGNVSDGEVDGYSFPGYKHLRVRLRGLLKT